MSLLYLLFILFPPSWEFTGEISSATSIYDIVEAQDGSIICGGAGGSYGLWRSTDNGNTWSNVGPATSSSFRSLLKTSGGILYAGRDDGWLYKSTDNGANWSSVLDLDLSIRVLFETSGGVLLAGTQTDTAEIYRSSDGGNTWAKVNLPGNLDVYSFAQFPTGKIVCGTNSNTVYISDDNGSTWSAGGTLTGATSCYALEVYGDTLYAGTDNSTGEVYRSTDFANSFTNLGNTMSTANVVYDFLFVGDLFFAATAPNGDVLQSENFGISWVNTGDLTGATTAYSLEFKSQSPFFRHMYCGTWANGDVFRTVGVVGVEESESFKPLNGISLKCSRPPTFFSKEIPVMFSATSQDRSGVCIYNVLGEKVYEKSYPRTEPIVLSDREIEKLGMGVYFLRVSSGNKNFGPFKIIKIR